MTMMRKVLVLGSDGRAHALVWKLFNSAQTGEMVCAPGNGGIHQIAPRVDLDLHNAVEVARWSFEEQVDLIVPAAAEPLQAGLTDEAVPYHLDVVGPPRDAARLGLSRCFAKEFLLRHGLPTANGRVFTNLATAERYLAAQPLPVVLKADHRADGSGVYQDRYAALKALKEFFTARPPESADGGRTSTGGGVVIESFLSGSCVSISALTDGSTVVPFLPTRVYHRLNEGDNGPIAPGMGAHTGTSTYARKLTDYVQHHLFGPLLAALNRDNLPYRGILGVDCIITDRGPRIHALRCAMRDMEAQVVLPRLEDDLMALFQAAMTGRLVQVPPLTWRDEASVGIALVAQGYPHHFPTGNPIRGIDEVDEGILIFHDATYSAVGLRYESSSSRGSGALGALIMGAGVGNSVVQGSTITTSGGHVLTVVALAATLNGARGRAIVNAERITFSGRFFRGDIGQREFS
jgi:phosphoribosylamine--glycine ligase